MKATTPRTISSLASSAQLQRDRSTLMVAGNSQAMALISAFTEGERPGAGPFWGGRLGRSTAVRRNACASSELPEGWYRSGPRSPHSPTSRAANSTILARSTSA
jgi:hypothetical protein